jgi:type II secretory pathway component PulM
VELVKLANREKWFLGGGGAFLLVFLLYGLILSPLFEKNGLMDRKIEQKLQELEEMAELEQEHRRLNEIVAEAEGKMRKRTAGFSMISYLEGISLRAGVNDRIDYMRPKPVPPGPHYRESAVEIRLKNVPLPDLVKFLYWIEYTPEFLKLNKVKLKSDVRNPSELEAIVEVSSYEIV